LIKVLLTDTLNPEAVELLKEVPEFEVVVKNGMTPLQLKNEARHYEALVVDGQTAIDKEILENAGHIKLIVRTGIGLDNIDVEAARVRNIVVKDTPLAISITVAEYTLAQTLAICRNIGPAYRGMKEHRWEKNRFANGIELFGKTSGIIGMGRIGKELARRQLAMGMKVIYYDIADIQTEIDARQVSLDELLRKSDFISILLPLSDSTRNMISTESFKKMKNGVVIINASNYGIIDENAMVKAIEKGKIRAVGVDVYEQEPLVDFKWIDNEVVFPTPHLGASTVEAHERAGLEAIAILKEFFNA